MAASLALALALVLGMELLHQGGRAQTLVYPLLRPRQLPQRRQQSSRHLRQCHSHWLKQLQLMHPQLPHPQQQQLLALQQQTPHVISLQQQQPSQNHSSTSAALGARLSWRRLVPTG